MSEIDVLIQHANQCDEEEDQRYREQTGYELPEDLKFKQDRLEKVNAMVTGQVPEKFGMEAVWVT